MNRDAHSSTVIDGETGTLISNIDLGGKPEDGASAGDGKLYVDLTDKSEVIEIDTKTAKVIRRWSTGSCKQPVAMAIDITHHRLFSRCRNSIMAVSDYQARKVVATIPIGGVVIEGGNLYWSARRRQALHKKLNFLLAAGRGHCTHDGDL